MEATNRLDFLKRSNLRRTILPVLKSKLVSVLGISLSSLNFLPLEESDQIRERASHSFPARNALERQTSQYPFTKKRVRNAPQGKPLLPSSTGDVFVLIQPEAETVGVLLLPVAILNKNWKELLDATSDGFVLVDTKFSNMVVADIEADVSTNRKIIELAAWGEEWSNSVRESFE
jgi:hypothetical protein